jgi:hypothetical protein
MQAPLDGARPAAFAGRGACCRKRARRKHTIAEKVVLTVDQCIAHCAIAASDCISSDDADCRFAVVSFVV